MTDNAASFAPSLARPVDEAPQAQSLASAVFTAINEKSRWLFSRAKSARLSRLIATAAILLAPLTAAYATTTTITITGTISSGSDTTGVFGTAGANLAGQKYNLVYTFDDTKGKQETNIHYPDQVSCGSDIVYDSTSSPGTAVLQIGNGSWSFGAGPIQYSEAQRYVGECSSSTYLYNYVEDDCNTCTSTNYDRVASQYYLPYEVIRGSEFNWATGFSFSGPFSDYSQSFDIDFPGQHASGYLTTTNITVSGAQSGWTITPALQFIPVTPCRVADTRNPGGPFGGPELGAGASREFDIPQSSCSIPNSAIAYSLNVTAAPAGALGYLTLWPSGQPQPPVSTLNSDGRVKANAAIVPAGTNGGVSVFVTDNSHVILDIDGYFVPTGTPDALAFYPLTPCRLADTRGPAGPLGAPSLGAGGTRDFPVRTANCRIPSGAKAYSLNVTAIPKAGLGYLTMWPTGEAQPVVSTLNAPTGNITANGAFVPAGNSGDISVYVSDASDVIVDVNGFFATPASDGLSLYATTPCRVLDTRSVAGTFNGVLDIPLESSVCPPSTRAQADILNATVLPATTLGYLSLWPTGATQPEVSTLNAADGTVTSNLAIVPTLNGSISAFSSDPTQLIVDLSGYFAP